MRGEAGGVSLWRKCAEWAVLTDGRTEGGSEGGREERCVFSELSEGPWCPPEFAEGQRSPQDKRSQLGSVGTV